MAGNSTYYFAWVDVSETTFDPAGHAREDELIFSFKLVHDEGQFATLDLEIMNPRIGLLNPSRLLWAWFSWNDGSATYPLFFGRIVGIPTDLFAEVITVQLIGKPDNYIDQQQAVANALNFLPYFDPIFVDPTLQTDPDTVLEAYSALWHVDRVTGVVTTSDLIVGEDGTDVFTADDVFYDSVKIEIGQAPLTEVDISASVQWHQTGGGSIDLGTNTFTSYTSGLLSDWPKIGDNLQGGYTVTNSSLVEVIPPTPGVVPDLLSNNLKFVPLDLHWSWQNIAKTHADGDTMSVNGSATGVLNGRISKQESTLVVGDPYTGTAASGSISIDYVGPTPAPAAAIPQSNAVPTYSYVTTLALGMQMDQSRMETVKFSVTADLQPILTEPDEKSIVESISLQASDVVAAGALNSASGAYFATDRGILSIEYMMLIARAHLLAKARVIKTSWDCSFPRIINMSCRLNALLEDNRLPGGSVLGKVTHYEMDGNGDTGDFTGSVSIESAVGYGNTIETSVGTSSYAIDGYVDTNYQYFTGALVAVGTGDIAFSAPIYPNIGLQNPLTSDQVLVRMEWHDSFVDEQVSTAVSQTVANSSNSSNVPTLQDNINGGVPDSIKKSAQQQQEQQITINQVVHDNQPWLEIELKPITGISTSIEYDITLTSLVVPQQIDLSAESTAS